MDRTGRTTPAGHPRAANRAGPRPAPCASLRRGRAQSFARPLGSVMADPVHLDSGIADTLLRTVETHQSALVELAGSLIACRTDSQSEDNPEFPTEARRCQEIVAAWLSDLGAEVQ